MATFAEGLKGSISFRIEEDQLASKTGSGDTRVFATPMLVAGMEQAAVKALAGCLDPELTTVGTHIDVYHRLASPLGMTVTCEAILKKISPNGKGLFFTVHAHDEGGNIGYGTHERVVVNREKFEATTETRLKEAGQGGTGRGSPNISASPDGRQKETGR